MSATTEKEHQTTPVEVGDTTDHAERMRTEQKGVKREREEVNLSPAGDEPKKAREEVAAAAGLATAAPGGGFAAPVANPWALPPGTSGFGSGAAASSFGSSAWSASSTSTSTPSPWSLTTPAAAQAAAAMPGPAGPVPAPSQVAAESTAAAGSEPATVQESGWLSSAWSVPAVSKSVFAAPTAGLGSSEGGGAAGAGWPVTSWSAAIAAAGSAEPLGASATAQGSAAAGAGRGNHDDEEEEDVEGEADAEAHNAALLAADGGGAAGSTGLLDGAAAKPLPTGEEQEVTILQLRGKLFVLEKESEKTGTGAGAGGESEGGHTGGAHGKGTGLGSTGLGTALGSKVNMPAPTSSTSSTAPLGRWRECGTGPLRLNVRLDMAQMAFPRSQLPKGAKSSGKGSEGGTAERQTSSGPVARFIMRQETGAGASHSASGRVLLNAPLHAGFLCSVHPQNNRAVQFTAPEVMAEAAEGSATTSSSGATRVVLRSYLLRLAGPDAALDLVEAVQEMKQNLGSLPAEEEGKQGKKV